MVSSTAAGSPRTDSSARRRLLFVLALLIAGSILGVLQLILQMQLNGRVDYPWVFGLIVFDAIFIAVFAVFRRTREHQFGDLEQRLATRTKEQGSSRGGWNLAVFDNGLVMQAQRLGFIVSFYLCYGPDLQRYAPTLAEIREYMRGTGVMLGCRTSPGEQAIPVPGRSLNRSDSSLGPDGPCCKWRSVAPASGRP